MSINSYSAVVKTFAGNGKNSTANGAAGASSLARPYIICPVPDTESVLICDQLQIGLRVADA